MGSNITIKVHVKSREGKHNTLKTQSGQDTLMHVLRDEDQGIEAVCGGCSSCATCHVFIPEMWMKRLPERGDIESMLLGYQEHFDPACSRLSCQLNLSDALDGIEVEIAPEE